MDLSIVEAALRSNTRLILPGLGAFLRQDNAMVLDVALLTFSPFLRHNDGVLDGYIAQSMGLSHADARAYAQQLVDQIESELSMGGSCWLPGLGSLRREMGGMLTFEPQGGAATPTVGSWSAPVPEIDTTPSPSVGFDSGTWNAPTFGSDTGAGATDSGMGYTPFTPDPEPVLSFDFSPTEQTNTGVGAGGYTFPTSETPSMSTASTAATDSGFGDTFTTPATETSAYTSSSYSGWGSTDYTAPSTGAEATSTPADSQLDTGATFGGSFTTPAEETQAYTPSSYSSSGTTDYTAPSEPAPSTGAASDDAQTSTGYGANAPAAEEGSRFTNCSVPPVSVASQDDVDAKVKPRKGRAKRVVLTLLLLLLLGGGGFWAYCHWMDPALEMRLQGQLAQLLHRSPLQASLPPSTLPAPTETPEPAVEPAASDLQRDFQARATQGGDSVTAQAAPSEPETPARPAPEPEPAPTPQRAEEGTLSVDASMPYHIVLGSFRNSEYAEQFSQMMAEEGFKSVIIEQSSGMSAVAVASFSSRSAAANALAALQPQYPQAWILEQ